MSHEQGKAAKKERYFTTMPARTIGDTRLTALELRCLMVISYHDGMSIPKGRGAGCYASLATLSRMVQTDITNLSKGISRLTKLGYVTKERQQVDKRRSTLRVIHDAPGKEVGELTNHQPEIDGEPANDFPEIVGEGELQTHAIPPKTDTQYISLNEEINSDKSEEINSDESAQFADREQREIQNSSVSCRTKNVRKMDFAEARLGRRECVSLSPLLPKRWAELPPEAMLAQFEKAFASFGRNSREIETTEREQYLSWLFAMADAEGSSDDTRHRARRLLEEMEAA